MGGLKERFYGSRSCRLAIGVDAVEVIETFIRGEVFSCVLIAASRLIGRSAGTGRSCQRSIRLR